LITQGENMTGVLMNSTLAGVKQGDTIFCDERVRIVLAEPVGGTDSEHFCDVHILKKTVERVTLPANWCEGRARVG
jgi:hypothetical protein